MKTIIVTHIDTAGHGYLSVSKKDFLRAGGDPKKITYCSGHTYTRLYLEEDCDASYFAQLCEQNGIPMMVKSSYNPKFGITHDYDPAMFDFKPTVGTRIYLSDKKVYEIVEVKPNGDLIVENKHDKVGLKYRIGKYNPFQYIKGRA
jgi:hypothetical protein